jgi:hypothetical protein
MHRMAVIETTGFTLVQQKAADLRRFDSRREAAKPLSLSSGPAARSPPGKHRI